MNSKATYVLDKKAFGGNDQDWLSFNIKILPIAFVGCTCVHTELGYIILVFLH